MPRDLEADQVILQHRLEKPAGIRQQLPEIVRRERHVQEEADPPGPAEAPDVVRQEQEMIILHPDEIVGSEQRHERRRETGLDPPVAGLLPEIDPHLSLEAVEQRPERGVAEAVVVVVHLALQEGQSDELDRPGPLPDDAVHPIGRLHLAAPAEPETLGGALERRRRWL